MIATDGAIAQHEDHGLDGDPADQVSGGHVEMALQDGRHRDRELGQAPGDRQQDDPTERLAEVQPVVEGIGRPRQRDPGDPGDDRGGDEDRDEGRTR